MNNSHTEGEGLVSISLARLIELNRPASNLPLHHNTIRSLQSGDYLSRFKGRGMEFDEARPYIPGDDVRTLDWRVTARTGKAHTKLFKEERERAIFLSVDYRSTMRFATRGAFKSIIAARLAGLLAWAANHHGDRVGGQIFTDRLQKEFKPRRGKQSVLRLLKQLADLSAKESTYSYSDNQSHTLQQALSRLGHHTRPGSLVFIFSDFRGLDKTNEFHLIRLSRHCDVNLVFIFDPLECKLPERGDFRFTNGERNITYHAGDANTAEKYNNRFIDHQNRLKELAYRYGMGFSICQTTDDPVKVLQ